MKNRLTILFLLALASATAVTAQTPAGAENKAAAHPLSEAQVQAIKSIRAANERKAAPFALQLAAAAKQVYENMLSEKENAALRRRLSREMDEAVVKLLNIKGQSIREMVGVLTPAQKQLLRDEMRKPGAPGDLSELIAKLFNLPEK